MYDLILKGGTVVDGSRGKPFLADVAVKDGRIAAVSKTPLTEAKEIIDVSGKIVSPGFIDIHSHSERGGAYLPKQAINKILQGITTEIGGNCGVGPAPYPEKYLPEQKIRLGCAQTSISEYRDYVGEHGHVTNLGFFTGHTNLRVCVVDYSGRVPSEDEMKRMKDILAHEIEEGSFGISLGLVYPPSGFGKTPEIVELAKTAREHGALLSVHMRDEGPGVFDAIKEMITVAEQSGVRVEISHLKLMNKAQWGKTDELFGLIEGARARGLDIRADQYPFIAACTSLRVLVPTFAHDGGKEMMLGRLANADDNLKSGIAELLEEWGGAEGVLIHYAKGHPEYQAKRLRQVAEELKIPPVDALIKVIIDADDNVTCSFFCMSEDDVLTIMKKDYIAVCTDAWVSSYDKNSIVPHPRSFNTFTQFFQYVRENNLMSIEDAVYKCTALPADNMKLKDRGMLKEGYFADITVFDKDKITNPADYIESRVKPVGINYVIVNGKIAVKDNEVLDDRAGVFISPGK